MSKMEESWLKVLTKKSGGLLRTDQWMLDVNIVEWNVTKNNKM
jgi:hypothetical protein